jgi:RimJ/RimL family protein N-acetyltransferase
LTRDNPSELGEENNRAFQAFLFTPWDGCAFGTLGLNRLEIRVADGNQPSRAVAEKAGALYEGLQRSRMRVREKVHDAHMYALIRPGIGNAGERAAD